MDPDFAAASDQPEAEGARHAPNRDDYEESQPRRLLYNQSRFTGAMTDDLYMQNSMATVLTANNVHLESSVAVGVIAEKVEAKSSACLFMLAGEVNGDVRPLFSNAGALLVSGAVLLGWAIYGRVAKQRARRHVRERHGPL